MNRHGSDSDSEASEGDSNPLHHISPEILDQLAHLNLAGRLISKRKKSISTGAYGDICRGKYTVEGRGAVRVAIKCLRFYLKEDIRLLFEKEVYVWSKLKHDNILSLLGYDFDEGTGYPLLVSEWMDNGSAWTYVRSHPEADVMRLISGIARGLAYLHEEGVVHSDIKSDNILVSDGGEALICDFGCSRVIAASRTFVNLTSGLKGTSSYLAYELVTEHSMGHTKQTDVWAFGMTVFELLTERRPFEGLSDIQAIAALQNYNLPPFPQALSARIPDQEAETLKDICLSCWKQNPLERPSMTRLAIVLDMFSRPRLVPMSGDTPANDSEESIPELDQQYAHSVSARNAAPHRGLDGLVPPRVTSPHLNAATANEDECKLDDNANGGSSWQIPGKHLRPKRPALSVITKVRKADLPLPPLAACRSTMGDKDGERRMWSERENQVIKASQNNAMSRPRPEEIISHLEAYFPYHDMDKLFAHSTSSGSSLIATEPSGEESWGPSVDEDKKSGHKESIRLVASESRRKFDKSRTLYPSRNLRRRSTKLWGSKVEEVATSQVLYTPPVPETSTSHNPTAIFKWVRGELIGKGTYGSVYLALNATTGEMLAVKQVELPRRDVVHDNKGKVSVVDALKSESETLKDLDHPNIVQYLGFEQTPDMLSIFLEYVPGGSISELLQKYGKFGDQISRSFSGQIVAGLEYLHNNGVIHRDLKTDNVLVDPMGTCKISDFGISKRTDDINENGLHSPMPGYVFWMAPEVIRAARKGDTHGYNGKVDIWSLGCVVLEMWAGRRPWQGADAIDLIYELITKQGVPPIPPDIVLEPDAEDFRKKCFEIEPDDRPSASEMRQHPYLILRPGWTFTGFKFK